MKTVDVVIPVHNSVHWLAWCLEELFRFDSIRLHNVFVINDRSNPDETKKINEIISLFPKVKLISNNSEIGGFGFSCNMAATKCSADIILFLNTDCLVTEGLIDRLGKTFDLDQKVALACPFSNNSPILTYPMLPGASYREMADLFAKADSNSETDSIIEVCTIVGNCLMVRRDFFEKVGGFSSEWGIGYGEETDLHLKALSQGLKGVAHLGCYVYHFGGGTFNYEEGIEIHREKNYQLFMSKWAKEYKALETRCENINPIVIVNKRLEKIRLERTSIIELDVLFYLPGIDQGVGGVNAVIAICNELVRSGIRASIALVGASPDHAKHYQDPVLFNFLFYDSPESFLADNTVIPKVIFSTICWSAPIVAQFAQIRGSIPVQFIQGYEGFFWNGTRYNEAIDSYKNTKHLVTTSTWLFNIVNRHLSTNQQLQQLPLVVNTEIFFSGSSPRPIDVILVFRSAPDKGQWWLAEILDRLVKTNKAISVLCASEYSLFKAKYENRVQFIDLPIDQYSLAKILRQSKVYVDASLHEGYGLIPLEAALCGCSLVLSDSGGVRDFIHNYNGELIPQLLDLENVFELIIQKVNYFSEKKYPVPFFKLNYSGKEWREYFHKTVANAPSIELTSKSTTKNIITPPVQSEFNQLSNSTIITKVESDNFIRGFYKQFIAPKIPQRLHLALKILMSGKT